MKQHELSQKYTFPCVFFCINSEHHVSSDCPNFFIFIIFSSLLCEKKNVEMKCLDLQNISIPYRL